MICYERRSLDSGTVEQLIALSQLWVGEDCSYGMVENQPEDLKEPLVVALNRDRIVGYAFGHFYRQERRTSYIEIGSSCFSLDELYVLPEYRGQGIGKRLFEILESDVAGACSYITLATSTKNYKAILRLYIEKLGMNFHSAFLIKNISMNPEEEKK